jgi:alpha-beta hydrolase superfamily lysophospholipase
MPLGVRFSRAVDRAVLWRLGVVGITVNGTRPTPPGDPDVFWAAARLDPQGDLEEQALRTPRRHRAFDNGVVRVELTGPSEGPGEHWGASNLRATALLHPDPAAPVVVVLHGYAVPTPWYEERTMYQLLRRGMSGVRVELPFHLSRRLRRKSPGHGFFSTDMGHVVGVLRQAVEDIAAVIAWSRRRGARAVGLHGVSLGGLVAALYAANCAVDSAVIITPPCDLARIILETAPRRLRRRLDLLDGRGGQWGADAAAARAALEDLAAPVIPRRLRPRTNPDNLAIVVADHDLIVGAEPVRELAATWGTDLWSYPRGHVTVMSARGLTTRVQERLVADLGVPARLVAAG